MGPKVISDPIHGGWLPWLSKDGAIKLSPSKTESQFRGGGVMKARLKNKAFFHKK